MDLDVISKLYRELSRINSQKAGTTWITWSIGHINMQIDSKTTETYMPAAMRNTAAYRPVFVVAVIATMYPTACYSPENMFRQQKTYL